MQPNSQQNNNKILVKPATHSWSQDLDGVLVTTVTK